MTTSFLNIAGALTTNEMQIKTGALAEVSYKNLTSLKGSGIRLEISLYPCRIAISFAVSPTLRKR